MQLPTRACRCTRRVLAVLRLAHRRLACASAQSSAAERRPMLTPLSAKKRENAHFCFTSCSFFVEPRGKVVQNLEICPAHTFPQRPPTVHHPSTTTPSKTPLFDGFELPHARTTSGPTLFRFTYGTLRPTSVTYLVSASPADYEQRTDCSNASGGATSSFNM